MKFSLVHPVLGEIGDILDKSVRRSANIHYRPLSAHPLLRYDDIYQAGMLGALEGVKRYKPGGPASLKSFIFKRVNGAIQDHMRSVDHLTRTQRETARAIKERGERLSQLKQVEVSLPAAVHDMNERYKLMIRFVRFDVRSLDDFIFMRDGETVRYLDIITSEGTNPLDDIVEDSRRKRLRELIAVLPWRERAILRFYSRGMRLAHIGRIYGITESRVSQIKKAVLQDLRIALKGY